MTFADLHRPGDPFVLPNAWDVGSARALVAAGFPAVGTTSLGVAASHGLVDATREAADATHAGVAALTAADLGCWLTVDIEDGLSDDPERVADLAASLGVDGVNIEDASASELVDPAAHARKVAAVKAAAPDLFVNARTDVFWLGRGDLAEALARLRRYVDAGADGVFAPGAIGVHGFDLAVIEALADGVPAPLNVLASPRHTRTELGSVGVARVSTGSLLYRVALTAAVDAARAARDDAPLPPAISYAEVQTLHAGPA